MSSPGRRRLRARIRLGECAPRRAATINDQQARPSTSLFLRLPLNVEVDDFAEVQLSFHLRSFEEAL